MEKVKYAILGCGVISRIHAAGIANTEEAELVAVCDVYEENMKPYVEEHGCKAYIDYEKMLKDEDIEVVCICTPSGMHPEQTLMAAKAGKHVICEKPMAIHLEDVDRMIQACEDHNVLLATIFPWRMSPVIQYVRQFIADGGLGRLSLCSAHIKPFRDQKYYDQAGWRGTWKVDGGGVLMNQGIHTIDQLQWIVGPVTSLYGQARHVLRDIEVEDTAVTLLNFKNGAMGLIEASTTAYKTPDSICLHGEKGTIIINKGQITAFEMIDKEKVEIPEFEEFKVIPDGHRMQIRDMSYAVREGRQPIVTGHDGRHSLEIILGTYASSKSKKEFII